MKTVITILILIITTNYSYSQIDSTKLDTIRVFVHVIDTIHYYDYYNANGVVLWKNVKGYDQSLIPNGGYFIQGKEVNPAFSIINGFGVIRWNKEGKMVAVEKWLDATKKEIKNKWVAPELILR